MPESKSKPTSRFCIHLKLRENCEDRACRSKLAKPTDETAETIRELTFKVRSMGLLLNYALTKLPKEERDYLGCALFRLASHTRGEHPFSFQFEDKEVRVA